LRRAPPFLILGNPENRRVSLFQEALAAQGLPSARVIAWADLVRSTAPLEAVPNEPTLVRIDSFGESFDVEKGLLARGFEDAARASVSVLPPDAIDALSFDRGRIRAPRQHHLGFLRVLGDVAAVLATKDQLRVLNPPASIADLFDKRVTSRRYASLGVPVPRFFDGIDRHETLRARLREAGVRTAYVKLSCGSSASCLALYHLGDTSEIVTTTIEQASEGWYNSLKVRRYRAPHQVAEILEFLLREGSQVEESVPKARLDGAFFDCRVLVIAGEPAFTVVRQSRLPITNLHLGGRRGDLDALHAAAPASVIDSAMDSCRRVHAAHQCLHVGVDLMYEDGYTGHRVLEANAFGDLLPNLQRDGLSVYEWEIREALRTI
jgi:hypothetical protein